MQVDTGRFLQDLNELRRIGEYKTGVHRPTYSPEDMESSSTVTPVSSVNLSKRVT